MRLYREVKKAKNIERLVVWQALQRTSIHWQKKRGFSENWYQKSCFLEADAEKQAILTQKQDRISAKREKLGTASDTFYDEAVFDVPSFSVYKELTHLLHDMHILLKKKKASNIEWIVLLRKALENKAYQFLKENWNHPVVSYLHTMAQALFIEPSFVGAFSHIGQKLTALVTHEEKKTPHLLFMTRKRAYTQGDLIENDISLRYAMKFPKNALGALSSTPLLSWCFQYDPRVSIENNSGALYEETLDIGGSLAQFRSIYTPTPTIHHSIAPEMHAVLQAIENNWFMTDKELEQELFYCFSWHYTNLQNITSGKEAIRSQIIMQLQVLYPFSFNAITITQDSAFYRDGVDGRNESLLSLHSVAPQEEEYGVSYKEKMLQEILKKENYSLKDRENNPGGGYYFPIREEERKAWENAVIEIVEKAHILTVTGLEKEKNSWMKKACFRELVHLGLIRYSQVLHMKKIVSKKRAIVPTVLITKACKECIDRGGKMHAEFLWALGKDQVPIELVVGALHSRALLSRYRLILLKRLFAFVALMHLDKKSVHTFLFDVLDCIDEKITEKNFSLLA